MEVEKVGQVEAPPFALVERGDGYVKYATSADVPEGTDFVGVEKITAMGKEEMGKLYGKLAGVAPKTFRDKKTAVESILYQVGKMTTVGQAPSNVAKSSANGAKSGDGQRESKRSLGTIEVLPSTDPKVLAKLPPQARELVLIMSEMALASGSNKIPEADYLAHLDDPSVAPRLKTKQPTKRIYGYYKDKLVGYGLISVVK